jgi:succinate dehydrogenase/fumarate reductase flavoprotein subunit
MNESIECDVLVIGSGAGGLSTAITARKAGLDVIVAEKEPVFGGTTAFSGGVLWIPGSPHGRRQNAADNREAAREYLRHECGAFFDAAAVDAFLDHAPAMVEWFERETSGQVRSDALPRLPPHGAGRRGHRPLDPRRALRHPRAGRRHGATASAAADHHLHRHDVQLEQRRPEALLQRHQVADVLRTCASAW